MKLGGLTLLLCWFAGFVAALNNKELLKLQNKSSDKIIKLTKRNFENILSGPSDSHILVLLTATNVDIGCAICVNIAPEYKKLASSWAQDHPDGDNLFFAKADFADGNPEIFQKFQLNSVPKVYLYTPSGEVHDINTGYNSLNIPQDPTEFASYFAGILSTATNKSFEIHESFDFGSAIITGVFVFLIVVGIKRNSKKFVSLITRKELWGAITVISILFFVTGHMFNAIRGVPYVKGSPDGRIHYFTPGQQQQLGAETQAMTFVYGILAFSVVSLITKSKAIRDEKVNLIVVGGLLGLILVFYSVLISIFQFKSQGYPFHLLSIWSP